MVERRIVWIDEDDDRHTLTDSEVQKLFKQATVGNSIGTKTVNTSYGSRNGSSN
jgi:hypothetical protein